jgi:flagellar biosynthesis/type III secretory pathway protein FliH
VLKDFLIERRSEVVKMMQLDYTFERQLTLERQDSREEGRAEGREEGRKEGRAEGRAEGREEGRTEGRSQGELKKLITLISQKKAKSCTVSDTADMLETDSELVQKVYDALETYDVDSQWEDIIKLIK